MNKKLDFLNKTLVDKAVAVIDLNGIPSQRKAVGYCVLINNKSYPFKLLVTEAAKIADNSLTSADFSSSEKNRKYFSDLTGYSIVQLDDDITFENLSDLIDIINKDLGDFCATFQRTKKSLFNKKRINSAHKLFVLNDKTRDWSINEGGGTELQYHLFLRNNVIGYGLGFNTQYVPFANDLTPINHMVPFAISYLAQKKVQENLINHAFKFIVGDKTQLENLQDNNYVLIGKQHKVQSTSNSFSINYSFYSNMLQDIKSVLFDSYKAIVKNKDNFKSFSPLMQKYIDLLNYKKQIILQGPPGTGKTRLAKQVAAQLTTSGEDYELIQFHPSYTYEDFVRGITVKNNDNGDIEYSTENKTLVQIAERALTNYNNYAKENTVYSKEVTLNTYFELFIDKISEDIEANNGSFNLTENVGLISLDEDAFRYKGMADGWSKKGDRMKFKDIKQAFLDGNINRQDLKKNTNLSGLAKQHASYFVRVLNMFHEFLKEKELTFNSVAIEKEPLKNYVLIIDEINRANLSAVLGELIYALEYRGEAVESMYEIDGKREIILPPNLFIIGTMNTADRSVGQIDYAIRRRFAFADVLPEDLTGTLEDGLLFESKQFQAVKDIFKNHLSEEFEINDVQLGHSYFIYKTADEFNMQLTYEIKPILFEYIRDGILKASTELNNLINNL